MNIKFFVTVALTLFLVGFSISAVIVYLIGDTSIFENQQVNKDQTNKAPTDAIESKKELSSTSEPSPTSNTDNQTTLACGNGGLCTTEEVAKRNSPTDCWGIYNDKVYNLTAYVPQHEGGSAAFNSSSCGTDMTKYLNGTSGSGGVKKYKHSQNAYNILSSYYIADLK